MATIQFDFDTWDKKYDVPLNHPGTDLGFGIINLALQPGHGETRRDDDRGVLSGKAIDGIIGTLAGAIEWLREYGFTAEEVQSRVRAYMSKNRGSRKAQAEKGQRGLFYVGLEPKDGITAQKIRTLN